MALEPVKLAIELVKLAVELVGLAMELMKLAVGLVKLARPSGRLAGGNSAVPSTMADLMALGWPGWEDRDERRRRVRWHCEGWSLNCGWSECWSVCDGWGLGGFRSPDY